MGGPKIITYRSRGVVIVGALARDLEGNIVGCVALNLEGTGRQVVEILVQELEGGDGKLRARLL